MCSSTAVVANHIQESIKIYNQMCHISVEQSMSGYAFLITIPTYRETRFRYSTIRFGKEASRLEQLCAKAIGTKYMFIDFSFGHRTFQMRGMGPSTRLSALPILIRMISKQSVQSHQVSVDMNRR
jgi:hypothetical protein